MAKFLLITFLVASFCLFGSIRSEDLRTQFDDVKKDALAQIEYCQNGVTKVISEKVEPASAKATTDEQKACVDAAKTSAELARTKLVDETVGSILPKFKIVDDAPENHVENRIKQFFKQLDYKNFRQTQLASCNLKLLAFTATLRNQINDCFA